MIDFVNQQWDYGFEKELLFFFTSSVGKISQRQWPGSNHPIIQLSHAPTQPFSWSKSFFQPKPSAGSGSFDWHTQRQLVDPRLKKCLLHNYAMVECQTIQVNLNIILIYVYKYIKYIYICIWSVNLMFNSNPLKYLMSCIQSIHTVYATVPAPKSAKKHISWVHFGFPLQEPGHFLSSSSSLTAASACCVSSNGQRVRKSVLYDTFEIIHPGQSSYLAAWFSSHGSSKWVAWFHGIFPFHLSSWVIFH